MGKFDNDSQLTKNLPKKNLSLKYFECRAEVIYQFITGKSLVSIRSPKFHHFNMVIKI